MKMEFTLRQYEELLDKLEQITESLNVITERLRDADSVDSLLGTPWGMTTLDACIMRLQVVGELVRTIDNHTEGKLFAQYPAIPWKRIIGMRNFISHEYANLDYDMIWEIFTKYLHPLASEIDHIKDDLKENIL